jgi:hypothetical protein
MDYGFLNSVVGRQVGGNFWGTRLEHIIGVATAIVITGHSSAAINSLGMIITFAVGLLPPCVMIGILYFVCVSCLCESGMSNKCMYVGRVVALYFLPGVLLPVTRAASFSLDNTNYDEFKLLLIISFRHEDSILIHCS